MPNGHGFSSQSRDKNKRRVMRILFTTTAGLGHFHPLVPLARAAAKAGHEVAFACPKSLCARVEASGFRAYPLEDNTGPDPERDVLMERAQQAAPGTANRIIGAEMFVGIGARRALPKMIALVQSWKPDLIVRDEYELAGALAAERFGLPHAMVQVTFPSDWNNRPDFANAVLERLEVLRAQIGLPSDPKLEMLYRHLVLSFDPPFFLDPNEPAPPGTQYLRSSTFDQSGQEELPAWLEQSHPSPLMYVTLGTEAPKIPIIFPAAYHAILEGLREEPGTVALTVGRERDPADLGVQPEHVHVERYIPQSLLLEHCDLVITHGGHNTVLAALHHGLPMVVIPFFADQASNAARCEALGVGRVIPGRQLTPDALRVAVREVLENPKYRQNAAQLSQQMREMPGLEHGVQLLENLVLEHKAKTQSEGVAA
jgi:UDP:flavonoid glycosyltransferase YjiC (YdhE family)